MVNLVLLVVDTLRKKDLEEEGRDIAPFLSERMEDSISLNNYYSNAPWTAPAHGSLFTGKLPSEHGTKTTNPFFNSENAMLALLRDKGFHTKGISENDWVSHFSGFNRGFDDFKDYNTEELGGEVWREIWVNDYQYQNRLEKWSSFVKKTLFNLDYRSWVSLGKHLRGKIRKSFNDSRPRYNPGEEVDIFSRASDYIDRSNNRFLFMNVLSVHDPYTFGQKQKEKFLPDYSVSQVEEISTIPNIVDYYSGEELNYDDIDLKLSCYRASIAYIDSLIEELYEESSQNTVFIVLGDHGELFGEYELHGKPLIGHQLGTFKELIEVPCVIFSKSGVENELDIDQDKVYDHRDIIGFIDNLTGGSAEVGKESTRSEYYGLKGLQKYRIRDISDTGMKFAERKSFSYVNRDYKFDLASDGHFLWPVDERTEETCLEIDCISEEARNKMQLLYQHNLQN